MNFLTEFVHWAATSPLIYRSGWTLLHSLWEFAALAGILSLALQVLAGALPRVRYLVATGTLILMFALPVLTFQFIGPSTPSSRGDLAMPATTIVLARASSVGQRQELIDNQTSAVPTPPPSLLPNVAGYLNHVAPWLIAFWSFGVLVVSIWHLGGWIALQRLRFLGTRSVDPMLVAKLSRLAYCIGLTRPVHIATSTLVRAPVLIGCLRPVILLPVAILSGLSPAYLEAILAHELAHVRRHDFLINLFQAVIETLLFYHPAVWWVSRLIRQERELCCDDIAICACGNSRVYAEALIRLEEIRPAGNRLALAATGGGGPLSQRIRRIIGLPECPSIRQNVSIIAIVLSLTVVLLPLLQQRTTAQAASPQSTSAATRLLVGPATLAVGSPGQPNLVGAVKIEAPISPTAAVGATDATPSESTINLTRTPAQFAPTVVAKINVPPAEPYYSPTATVGAIPDGVLSEAVVDSPPALAPPAPAVAASKGNPPIGTLPSTTALVPPAHPRVLYDPSGHQVVYDAADFPVTLDQSDAERLMFKVLRTMIVENRPGASLGQIKFDRDALGFTIQSAHGQFAGIYGLPYSHRAPVRLNGLDSSNARVMRLGPGAGTIVNLNDWWSFAVFKYGKYYAAGTLAERGLFGGVGYTFSWQHLTDAENFVRALYALNSRPQDLNETSGH